MRIFILGFSLLLGVFSSFGHNPLSARYFLEVNENATILTINLSQDGINNVLIEKLGKETFNQLELEQLKEQIFQYIRSNFYLSIDGEIIPLQEGGIKLGNHQTDLKFILSPLLQRPESIKIDIPAFQENDHHQSIFSYSIYGLNDHVVLDSSNNYKSIISFSNSTSRSWLWIISIIIIGFAVFFFLKKRQIFHLAK